MSNEPKPAASLSDAKVGDYIWFYDSQANRYVDGHYQGRGVWKILPIEGETRASFIIWQSKFDRQTGRERAKNGYTSGNVICGQQERDDREWRGRSYTIAREVEKLNDVSKLKAIAEILGFKL